MHAHTRVILKKDREKSILKRHPWIFSGAIHTLPNFINGDILPIYTFDKQFVGYGYFNTASNILGRVISFDETPPLDSLQKKLEAALAFRKDIFAHFPQQTNAYRLINGEGDGIPGLIVDLYDRIAVFQSSTLGIDKLKSWFVDYLVQHLKLEAIYEKSLSSSRLLEKIPFKEGFIYGKTEDEVFFKENGFTYTFSLKSSQKTGFFLDQREMRVWVKQLAYGKKVLNAFSYTGGFTLSALAGGAFSLDSVEISKSALEREKHHLVLNDLSATKHQSFNENVFDFLQRMPSASYDFIILDPPAFIKKKSDLIPGCRGYKEINRLAIQKSLPKTYLLTASCSSYMDATLFQKVIFQASVEAKREVRIIGSHRLALDHPISPFHPEGHYLKSLLLYIE